MTEDRPRGLAVAALLTFALGACADVPMPQEPDGRPQFASSGPVLVECPSDQTTSAEGVIGSTGGELRLRNHTLVLPKQAVQGPQRFRITDPASQYMEMDLRGNGQESFGFNKPVTITIDYSRCTRSNIDHVSLAVWKIDPITKALLKNMGGIDDPVGRTVTFTTDSLSAYVIAD